ncbi:MAG TPA: transglutaminase family protein, partial [Gammaproteobacteria bacterium]|nr:transglutaminase family protein [Gammaproteobacteria bacterium]
FNLSLCDKFDLKPLEFDGQNDSLFHEFDQKGNKHMEYLQDRGFFADVPFERILATFKKMYKP